MSCKFGIESISETRKKLPASRRLIQRKSLVCNKASKCKSNCIHAFPHALKTSCQDECTDFKDSECVIAPRLVYLRANREHSCRVNREYRRKVHKVKNFRI